MANQQSMRKKRELVVRIRRNRPERNRPHGRHSVPIIFLPGEFENPRTLRNFANGAPDMKVMGTKINGRLRCLCPINGSFAPSFRTLGAL